MPIIFSLLRRSPLDRLVSNFSIVFDSTGGLYCCIELITLIAKIASQRRTPSEKARTRTRPPLIADKEQNEKIIARLHPFPVINWLLTQSNPFGGRHPGPVPYHHEKIHRTSDVP